MKIFVDRKRQSEWHASNIQGAFDWCAPMMFSVLSKFADCEVYLLRIDVARDANV